MITKHLPVKMFLNDYSIKLLHCLTVTVSSLSSLLNKESGSLPGSVYFKFDWKNDKNICRYLSVPRLKLSND